MLRNLKDKNVLEFPPDLSESGIDGFLEELIHHLDNNNNKVVIDCLSIEKMNQPQSILLDKIAELSQNHSIQILIKPELRDIPESALLLCRKVNTDSSESHERELKDVNKSLLEYLIQFYPTTEEIQSTYQELTEFLDKNHCSSKSVYVIKSIFYEFVNNIHLHSGMDQKDKMQFQLKITDSEIVLTFIDSGMYFDVSKEPNGPRISSYNEIERFSFGIQIINTLSDEIRYKSIDNSHNTTTIICRRNNE